MVLIHTSGFCKYNSFYENKINPPVIPGFNPVEFIICYRQYIYQFKHIFDNSKHQFLSDVP